MTISHSHGDDNGSSNEIQQSKSEYHPLLRELKIAPLDAISPSDVLSYLLETNVLPEETVRNAVQAIRRKRQQAKGIRQTEEKIRNDTNRKKSAAISPGSNRTRHIALRFLYDGALFSGLSQNIGQENDNSVERCLFDALLRARLVVSRETSGYSRCGRTDRGVSAAGQVVALHLKSAFPVNASWVEDGSSIVETKDLPRNENESRKVWIVPRSSKKKNTTTNDNVGGDSESTASANRTERDMKEYPYSKILNNLLPPSIRILGWAPVTDEFSARFSASARTYRYFFCKRQMNVDLIRNGLQRLVGKHDFRNLCKMDVSKVYNFERVIHSAELVEINTNKNGNKEHNHHHEVCYLQIIGQAFLWHQIRCIAEVIFMVGNGFESPSIITELLNVKKHPGKPSYPLADEKPLVLHDCDYPNLQIGYSVQNLWTVSCQLEKQWEELTLAAARIRNGINSFRSIPVLKQDLITFSDSKLKDRSNKLLRKGMHHSIKTSLLDNQGEITDMKEVVNQSLESSTIMSWADSLFWLERRNLVPDSNGLTNSVHVPLMQRSMGPSYEEKVESLKKSERRRQKYEENVIKKRKTAEEDRAFYDHKIKQGGCGM